MSENEPETSKKDVAEDVAEVARRAEFIAGLRAYCLWLEQHKSFPLGYPAFTHYICAESLQATKKLVNELGSFTKIFNEATFALEKEFCWGVKIRVFTERENVCTRKVVGTRTIAAVPAQPEFVVDIVEWSCPDSILSKE